MSVYYVEAYAIVKGLEIAEKYGHKDINIYSDSLSVLLDVKYFNLTKSAHPGIIFEIGEKIRGFKGGSVKISWLPSNKSINMIKKVDGYAKAATRLDEIEKIIMYKKEKLELVQDWIWKIRKEEWEKYCTCKYKEVYTLNRLEFSTKGMSRRQETIINRLRLQQNGLNAGKYKLGLHETGNCDSCGSFQDVKHFLMECKETRDLRKELKTVITNEKDWNIKYITTEKDTTRIVINYI